jgi:hypothetical protein
MSAVASSSLSDFSFVSHPNFFPEFSRELTEAELSNHPSGTFLVRPSSHPGHLVISLVQKRRVLHLLVDFHPTLGWSMESNAWNSHQLGKLNFSSLEELLAALKQAKFISNGIIKEKVCIQTKSKDKGNEEKNEKLQSQQNHENPINSSVFAGNNEKVIKFSDYSGLVGSSPPLSDSKQGNLSSLISSETSSSSFLSSSSLSSAEFEYRGMLSALLPSRTFTSSDVNFLLEWRKIHQINQNQHEKVLNSMGITGQEFDIKCQSACTSDNEAANGQVEKVNSNSTECVVCLTETRACCFLPCGHLSTCFDCAVRLKECPICRSKIEKIQKVYL